jgi:hypothetical protein
VIVMLALNLAHGGSAKPKDDLQTKSVSTPSNVAPANPVNGGESLSGDLLEANDEGLVDGGAAGIARRVRYTSVERRSWTDANGAVTLVEIPREDVVALPVTIQ